MSGKGSKELKQGSLVRERDSSEWVIVSIHGALISRVRRNSLAHIVHAQSSPVMRETLQVQVIEE